MSFAVARSTSPIPMLRAKISPHGTQHREVREREKYPTYLFDACICFFDTTSSPSHSFYFPCLVVRRAWMSTPATFCTSSASNVNNCFLPRVATHCFKVESYSKRKGPLKGEDHQICRLGVCLFRTQVPCSPIRMLRTPCCKNRERGRDELSAEIRTHVHVNR